MDREDRDREDRDRENIVNLINNAGLNFPMVRKENLQEYYIGLHSRLRILFSRGLDAKENELSTHYIPNSRIDGLEILYLTWEIKMIENFIARHHNPNSGFGFLVENDNWLSGFMLFFRVMKYLRNHPEVEHEIWGDIVFKENPEPMMLFDDDNRFEVGDDDGTST